MFSLVASIYLSIDRSIMTSVVFQWPEFRYSSLTARAALFDRGYVTLAGFPFRRQAKAGFGWSRERERACFTTIL